MERLRLSLCGEVMRMLAQVGRAGRGRWPRGEGSGVKKQGKRHEKPRGLEEKNRRSTCPPLQGARRGGSCFWVKRHLPKLSNSFHYLCASLRYWFLSLEMLQILKIQVI